MKIPMVIFDVQGFLAHFRRHHTTTSSLSYAFPPRTSLVGLIAALLGYDRDSYYGLFESEKCRVALQVRVPVRRLTFAVNYLQTDAVTIRKLRGLGGSMPIHMELLVAETLRELCYRVFFNHRDRELLNEFARRLNGRRFCYPPSLGTANCLAELEYVDRVDAEVFTQETEIKVSTVLPTSLIKSVQPQEGARIYVEENVPADFTPERNLHRIETYIYERNGKPIKVSLKGEVFRCMVNGEELVGVFM